MGAGCDWSKKRAGRKFHSWINPIKPGVGATFARGPSRKVGGLGKEGCLFRETIEGNDAAWIGNSVHNRGGNTASDSLKKFPGRDYRVRLPETITFATMKN